uniref:Uncharacterized protein n=1 Tax=Globisporangium ultimum (strain ATCC 200006 / CBS 805.95 / DAOM BR144) TaxID=431595 RepID=K3X1L8_GLOUD
MKGAEISIIEFTSFITYFPALSIGSSEAKIQVSVARSRIGEIKHITKDIFKMVLVTHCVLELNQTKRDTRDIRSIAFFGYTRTRASATTMGTTIIRRSSTTTTSSYNDRFPIDTNFGRATTTSTREISLPSITSAVEATFACRSKSTCSTSSTSSANVHFESVGRRDTEHATCKRTATSIA